MSLDIYLSQVQGTVVFDLNITHNLGRMASALGVYYPLWRPAEIGITKASEMIPFLKAGIKLLEDQPNKFTEYNPINGWGTMGNLLQCMKNYLQACIEFPEATIRTSR